MCGWHLWEAKWNVLTRFWSRLLFSPTQLEQGRKNRAKRKRFIFNLSSLNLFSVRINQYKSLLENFFLIKNDWLKINFIHSKTKQKKIHSIIFKIKWIKIIFFFNFEYYNNSIMYFIICSWTHIYNKGFIVYLSVV